jgi:hypothetical protein
LGVVLPLDGAMGKSGIGESLSPVIASEAKQSMARQRRYGLLRR